MACRQVKAQTRAAGVGKPDPAGLRGGLVPNVYRPGLAAERLLPHDNAAALPAAHELDLDRRCHLDLGQDIGEPLG